MEVVSSGGDKFQKLMKVRRIKRVARRFRSSDLGYLNDAGWIKSLLDSVSTFKQWVGKFVGGSSKFVVDA